MLRSVKQRLQGAVLPCLFIGLCAYFAHHAIGGSRGTNARELRHAEIMAARAELAAAEAERSSMERKVVGLRSEHLDRDVLEERARALLNVVARDEIIIPYAQSARLY